MNGNLTLPFIHLHVRSRPYAMLRQYHGRSFQGVQRSCTGCHCCSCGCIAREATSAAKEELLMTLANQDVFAPQALVWADLPSRQFDCVHHVQRGAAVVGPQALVLPGWPGCTCHKLSDDRLPSSAATLSRTWNPCFKICGALWLPVLLMNIVHPLYQSHFSSLLASYVTLRDFNIYYHILGRSSSLRYL
jgi:hypothetical protein